jgi:hypothetical protein
MESTKVGYWIQVGANVGISDSFLSMHAVQSGETLAVAWSKAVDEPDQLTTFDMIQLSGHLESMLKVIERRSYLYSIGVYHEIHPQEFVHWMANTYFGNVFAHAWWQERKKTFQFSTTAQAVDKAIASVSEQQQSMDFERIRKTISTRLIAEPIDKTP